MSDNQKMLGHCTIDAQFRLASCSVITYLVLISWVSSGRADIGDRVQLDGSVPEKLEPEVRDRFLKEAPLAWKELRSRLKEFQVRVDHSVASEGRDNEVDRRDRRWEFCVGSSLSQKLVVENGSIDIYGANDKYSFRVHRQSANRFYQLVECIPWSPRESEDQPLAGAAMKDSASFVDGMWSVWWVPLDYILSHDGFELIAAEGGRGGVQDGAVKVAFRYQGPVIPKPYCAPGAIYWAELHPSRSWVVLRSGVAGLANGGETLNLQVTMDYQEGREGVPFPSKILLEYEDATRNQLVEARETRFGTWAALSHSSDEFYLPYYGISESSVPSLTSPNNVHRMIVMLVGTAGIVAAVWIIIASRSRPAKDANSSQ